MKETAEKGSSYPLVAKPRDTEPAECIIYSENSYTFPLLARAVLNRPPNEDMIRGIRAGTVVVQQVAPIIHADRQTTLFKEAGRS